MRQMTAHSTSHHSPFLIQILNRCYQGSWQDFQTDWQRWLKQPGCTTIFTPNPEQIVQAQQDQAFVTVLMSATILLADGVGLQWAYRYLRRFSPQLVTDHTPAHIKGREVVRWWLTKVPHPKTEVQNHRTLLVGSDPGVATALVQQLDPCGIWCEATEGYQDVQHPTKEEEQALKELIVEWRPQVIFVAFGAPWQELWISRQQDWLAQQDVKIVMAVGGALDILSPVSKLQAPPSLLETLHLEWLWRLWQEPHRWRRQLRLVSFLYMVFTAAKNT